MQHIWCGVYSKIEQHHCSAVVVVVYLFQQRQTKHVTTTTKPGNQKGKCPSYWPLIAQTK